MTGLEKILDQIKQEAQTASEEKLAEAREEAKKLLADAKKNRESSYAAAIEAIDADVQQLLLRGQSAASLQERKMLLEAKQQMIQEVFENVVDTMLQLPQEEYFKLLLRMVDRYALQEKGCIHLSQQDLDRMPDSFTRELDVRQITIAEKPAQLSGGFILSYGEIEENCSFDALLAENREKLQDQIVQLIFQETC